MLQLGAEMNKSLSVKCSKNELVPRSQEDSKCQVPSEVLSVKDPTSTCDFCVVRASKTVHDDDDAKKWSGCIWLQLYSTWDVT